jgi:hypothetical protein
VIRPAAIASSAFVTALVALSGSAAASTLLGVNIQAHPQLDQLTAAKAAGADYARLNIRWDETQPARNRYSWDTADADISNAAKAGIQLNVVLSGSPAWAVDPAKFVPTGDAFPAKTADFSGWCKSISSRYGLKGTYWASHKSIPYRPIRMWQVWNEPNWFANSSSPVRPTDYKSILTGCGAALKKVDPNAAVIAAGLAQFNSSSSLAMDPVTFWKGLWKALGTKAAPTYQWDVHPYSDTAAHSAAVIPYVRYLMDHNGCKNCSIRTEEVGWASGSRGFNPYIGWMCVGSEAEQQTRGQDLFRLIYPTLAKNRVTSIAWYTWMDASDADCVDVSPGVSGGQGLVHRDGTPKPILSSFTAFYKKLHGLK